MTTKYISPVILFAPADVPVATRGDPSVRQALIKQPKSKKYYTFSFKLVWGNV